VPPALENVGGIACGTDEVDLRAARVEQTSLALSWPWRPYPCMIAGRVRTR